MKEGKGSVELNDKGLTDNEAFKIADWIYYNTNIETLRFGYRNKENNNKITETGWKAIGEGLMGN